MSPSVLLVTGVHFPALPGVVDTYRSLEVLLGEERPPGLAVVLFTRFAHPRAVRHVLSEGQGASGRARTSRGRGG